MTNLDNLHRGEEALRVESLRRIALLPDLAAHLSVIESCLDGIHSLLPPEGMNDPDQRTIGNIGIRIFNAINVSLKLCLSGYYQAAGLQLRDILETTFLLDYFSTDAALINRWQTMSGRDRERAFKPVDVRMRLDERDGFTEKRRAEEYKMLCTLAGHATPEGVAMLIPVPGGTSVHCGPFLEPTALEALVSETARKAVQAGGAFRALIKHHDLRQLEARIVFLEAEADWFERFYDVADRSGIATLRSMLKTLQSASSG